MATSTHPKAILPIVALAGLLTLTLSACTTEPTPAGGGAEHTTVLVTLPPLAWAVDQLAPDSVEVVVLLPPGANPRTHEPTIQQLRAVERARMWVTVGQPNFPFEQTWLQQLVEGREDLVVVSASAGVAATENDPHVWVSPPAMRRILANSAAALERALPDQAQGIRERLALAEQRVDEVDEQLGALLAPHEGRSFVVFHPAWSYFAEHYGLVQVAVEAEHKEPSPDELQHLIEHARELQLTSLFMQPQFARAQIDLLARELGVPVRVIDPLARDWDTNLLAVGRALAASFER